MDEVNPEDKEAIEETLQTQRKDSSYTLCLRIESSERLSKHLTPMGTTARSKSTQDNIIMQLK